MLRRLLQYGIFIYCYCSLLLYIQLLLMLQPKSTMGICISVDTKSHHYSSISQKLLSPVQSTFQLPSPLPSWPKGGGFATGVIDLGAGLQVSQVTSFKKIWASYEGGPDNMGATLFEPSPIPEGFAPLGCYGQPNNKPLYGWVLVARDCCSATTIANPTNSTSSCSANSTSKSNRREALANPTDYTLIWSSQSSNIKQDSPVFIWLPIPPDGYKAVGHLATTSPNKPPLDRVKCVLADLTDQCGPDGLIWGSNGLNVYSSRPLNIGVGAAGVGIGTFIAAAQADVATDNTALACLKNSNPNLSNAMPNMAQIEALIEAYSPIIYLHPNEEYQPSTVNWYFANGALLYRRGDESNPVRIEPNGSNLPQGGPNDGSYWLDLPINDEDKERVKRGDLDTAGCYFHIKPMLGGTFTDLAMWVFYPFNGPARAKVGPIRSVSLGKIGEHVGDWEHITLRVSNFNGELKRVYFSQHSKGVWEEANDIEFEKGNNRVVAYASLHGHAMYPKAGTVMQGSEAVGIRNDTERSGMALDAAKRYEIISAAEVDFVEPPWVNYMREWGPKISYDIGKEIGKITRFFPGKLKKEVEKVVRSLPAEVLGEEGPTGPKVKGNWFGDERQ